jgi:hypothetical protein
LATNGLRATGDVASILDFAFVVVAAFGCTA